MNYLYSDSDEEEQAVKTVRVNDTGSISQCAKVLVQGVPGIIDSAADITIMGSDLFRKVASVCRLNKRDFKSPGTTPHTYNQKPFTLHGRIDLDLTFGDTTMKTPVHVYVKIDASDQLLLSEGACRQLGIISYHPNVRRWNRSKLEPIRKSEEESGERAVAEDSEPTEKESHREVRVPAVMC